MQHDSKINMNISVGSNAQMVVYGRRTALPSPAVHDFTDIVRAERLGIYLNETVNRLRKRTTAAV